MLYMNCFNKTWKNLDIPISIRYHLKCCKYLTAMHKVNDLMRNSFSYNLEATVQMRSKSSQQKSESRRKTEVKKAVNIFYICQLFLYIRLSLTFLGGGCMLLPLPQCLLSMLLL
ncbi:hypothetical protein AMECASPLE_027668 [Ameca splendens]|uniref:Uncharacterized protein n=1 Tax=Ameca splendens TaxID=208324 RepID=A0ABV0XIC0_9TELE